MTSGSWSAVEVAPAALGEMLRGLRLGGEAAVGRMADSLARHGQLTAVTAFAAVPDRLEIVNGFKRLAAARWLEWPALRVEVLDIDVIQAKAALAQLNQASTLSELEEAWLVRSLYREDQLTQPQIGRLLRRHKAWVCRRFSAGRRECHWRRSRPARRRLSQSGGTPVSWASYSSSASRRRSMARRTSATAWSSGVVSSRSARPGSRRRAAAVG